MDEEERKKINENQRVQALIKLCRMPITTRNTHRFNTFIVGDNEKAFAAACDFIGLYPDGTARGNNDEEWATWEVNYHFLTFHGPPGRGKTHLAMAIGWHSIFEFDYYVLYWQVEDLLDNLRRSYNDDNGDSFDTIMRGCTKCELLILDDLGAEQSTTWARAKIDLIIDTRYINDLATIFTTNYEAWQFPDRIASRLAEGDIITLQGEDYRLLKARKRNYERQHKNEIQH